MVAVYFPNTQYSQKRGTMRRFCHLSAIFSAWNELCWPWLLHSSLLPAFCTLVNLCSSMQQFVEPLYYNYQYTVWLWAKKLLKSLLKLFKSQFNNIYSVYNHLPVIAVLTLSLCRTVLLLKKNCLQPWSCSFTYSKDKDLWLRNSYSKHWLLLHCHSLEYGAPHPKGSAQLSGHI